MTKEKSLSEQAAGKLISSIQKEWGNELGLDSKAADIAEDVMGLAHELLQASTALNMKKILGARTMHQYLGEIWIKNHSSVKPEFDGLIQAMEQEIA